MIEEKLLSVHRFLLSINILTLLSNFYVEIEVLVIVIIEIIKVKCSDLKEFQDREILP